MAPKYFGVGRLVLVKLQWYEHSLLLYKCRVLKTMWPMNVQEKEVTHRKVLPVGENVKIICCFFFNTPPYLIIAVTSHFRRVSKISAISSHVEI